MPTPSLRCKTLPLLLAVALAAPWASAAGPRRSAPPKAVAPSPFDLLDRTWAFLKSLWDEEGCRLDPNGRCLNGAQAHTDTGCRIDPNGHCLTGTTQAPVTDTGCMLDPNGSCRH